MAKLKTKERPAANCSSRKLTSDSAMKLAKIVEISQINRTFLNILDRVNIKINILAACMDTTKHVECSKELKHLRDAEKLISQACLGFLKKFIAASKPEFGSKSTRGER
jgi:hypothetical protein